MIVLDKRRSRFGTGDESFILPISGSDTDRKRGELDFKKGGTEEPEGREIYLLQRGRSLGIGLENNSSEVQEDSWSNPIKAGSNSLNLSRLGSRPVNSRNFSTS